MDSLKPSEVLMMSVEGFFTEVRFRQVGITSNRFQKSVLKNLCGEVKEMYADKILFEIRTVEDLVIQGIKLFHVRNVGIRTLRAVDRTLRPYCICLSCFAPVSDESVLNHL